MRLKTKFRDREDTLNKFDDLNRWFLSLGTGMTKRNKFTDQDDINEQVQGLKQSICEFRDQDNTEVQI
jgi:hypothetical protein